QRSAAAWMSVFRVVARNTTKVARQRLCTVDGERRGAGKRPPSGLRSTATGGSPPPLRRVPGRLSASGGDDAGPEPDGPGPRTAERAAGRDGAERCRAGRAAGRALGTTGGRAA